jgi:hypothetical protein
MGQSMAFFLRIIGDTKVGCVSIAIAHFSLASPVNGV